MRIALLIPVLLLPFAACTHRQHLQPPASTYGRKLITGTEAIEIVRADIQHRGGNPNREEYSASVIDHRAIQAEMKELLDKSHIDYPTIADTNEHWLVEAWHIWYPNNQGSSRFVPGGYTSYYLSVDGKILRARGGL